MGFLISDVYFRCDPPLDIGFTDLIDCFHSDVVEASVGKWLDRDEGKNFVLNIASKLVEHKQPGIIAEVHMRPPLPPPDTNTGYNPHLDERRPDTMIEYLKSVLGLYIPIFVRLKT